MSLITFRDWQVSIPQEAYGQEWSSSQISSKIS